MYQLPGTPPPLDLELYSRVSQEVKGAVFFRSASCGRRKADAVGRFTDEKADLAFRLLDPRYGAGSLNWRELIKCACQLPLGLLVFV